MHFLRRFLVFIQKYVYYHFIFPKINKRGGWNKSGGLENFSKINKRGGEDYSVLESILLFLCHESSTTCQIDS